MKTLSPAEFERSREFLYENARVLERRLFERVFADGPLEPVKRALAAYRNPDGGFGHALEPDVRAPASQPLHVEFALRTLVLADADSPDDPKGLCDFLASATTKEGGVPPLLPSARDSARAAHWTEPSPEPWIATTATIAASLRGFGVGHPWVARATQYCVDLLRAGAPDEAHGLRGAALLVATLPDAQAAPLLPRIAAALPTARFYVVEPPVRSYALTPLEFPAALGLPRELLEAHLDDLILRRDSDGGWPVDWVPPAGSALAEWRARRTLEALCTLREHGRL